MSAQPRRAAARPPAPADPGPDISEEEAAAQRAAEAEAAELARRGHGKPLHELSDDEQAARQEWVTQVARDAGLSGEV